MKKKQGKYLQVLDLRDDHDVLALLAEDGADILDALSIPDERGKDHVHALLNSKQKVRLVLFRHSRKVTIGTRKVAAFPRPKVASIFDFTHNKVGT